MKSYDVAYTESFIKGLSYLVGLSSTKLQKYADENNLFNILEHPNTIGPNKQQLEKIHVLNEFISSYRLLKLQELDNKMEMNSSNKAGEYFASLLGGVKDKEKFMVAFLDNGNHIIETKTISECSIGEAVVYPRNILKAALDCDCKSIILAHNHPGGTMKPSPQDRALTNTLYTIFKPLNINILDHIIVANSGYYSMAEKGAMPDSSCAVSYEAISISDYEKAFEDTKGFHNKLNQVLDENEFDEEREDEEWEFG